MEGSLKRNKKDDDLLHVYVVYSMKAPSGLRYGGGRELMDPLIPSQHLILCTVQTIPPNFHLSTYDLKYRERWTSPKSHVILFALRNYFSNVIRATEWIDDKSDRRLTATTFHNQREVIFWFSNSTLRTVRREGHHPNISPDTYIGCPLMLYPNMFAIVEFRSKIDM
jgi:hypothetical protein